MSDWNRREFGLMTLGAGLAAAAGKIDSTVNGVIIGVQTYSFRDRSLDAALEAMKQLGLGVTELSQEHVEPRGLDREALRQWRLETPLDHFRSVAAKIRDAGVELYAWNYSFRKDYTDAEIERGFEIGRAMGAQVMTASANVSVVKRVDPYAQKYKMRVGFHNHSRHTPDEFSGPEEWAEAMRGASRYIAINLDIGHFVAAGYDPAEFLAERHADIVELHLKDRKKNQGDNMPFGQGDTPVKEVLRVLRDKKLKIPANIEYEYKGGDTVEEVRRCYEYCRKAVEG